MDSLKLYKVAVENGECCSNMGWKLQWKRNSWYKEQWVWSENIMFI